MLDRGSLPASDAALPLPADRAAFGYLWPYPDALSAATWRVAAALSHRVREMPETREELRRDSRWPAFFPSPLCIATTRAHGEDLLEKVVGASIVNRFPYVIMLSFCRESLSERHHVRRTFMDAVEASGHVAVQFIMPGPQLQSVMAAINSVPEDRQADRFRSAGLPLRPTSDGSAPAFRDAYLVYEGRLVRPGHDFEGTPINDQLGSTSAAIDFISSRSKRSRSTTRSRPAVSRCIGEACRFGATVR
jgi:flavin reductase (DIM6/NTAB) family NADH-FMN oxidoreductase RutF